MSLHHAFKHLALGRNPIHVTYCSVQSLQSNQVQTLPPLLWQHTTGTVCTPAAAQSAWVCVFLPSQTTYRIWEKVMPLHPFGILSTEPPSRIGARKVTLTQLQELEAVFSRACVVHRLNLMSQKSFNQVFNQFHLGNTLMADLWKPDSYWNLWDQ